MKNLRYEYNRVYYRNIFKIKLEHKWKMLRLIVAAKLVRLANKMSPDFMREYERTVECKYEERWYG